MQISTSLNLKGQSLASHFIHESIQVTSRTLFYARWMYFWYGMVRYEYNRSMEVLFFFLYVFKTSFPDIKTLFISKWRRKPSIHFIDRETSSISHYWFSSCTSTFYASTSASTSSRGDVFWILTDNERTSIWHPNKSECNVPNCLANYSGLLRLLQCNCSEISLALQVSMKMSTTVWLWNWTKFECAQH